jgi:Ca2+-transporting ATPase
MVAAPHAIPADELAAALGADPRRGLPQAAIAERRRTFGANVVERFASRSLWQIALHQFTSLIVILLAAAAAVAFGRGDHLEGIAIALVLLINAAIGAAIEWQAERALARLRLQAEISARVIRDGVQREIPAAEIVVGDVVILEAGRRVPADARVLSGTALEAEESALTGESTPVAKTAQRVDAGAALPDRSCMVYLGTSVAAGHGEAIVTAVGEQTELGRIGKLVRESPIERTPLEKHLAILGRRLVHVALTIGAIVAVAGILRGEPVWGMIEFGISLAVAAVPEGLPAVTTLVLALGVLRMARRHAVVRRLPAVETLGSTTVICTDKTGTLTQNCLTVAEVDAADAVWTLTVATLCSDAVVSGNEALGDPTEVAIVRAAQQRGVDVGQLRAAHPRTEERPFDHESKRMITVHRTPSNETLAALKGAPRAVLERCAMAGEERQRLMAVNHALAARAFRVIGVAERTRPADDLESGYAFLGFIAMTDPPRPGAAEAIRRALEAGVRVVMLTGDQPETGRAVAGELQLTGEKPPRVVHARELVCRDDIRELVRNTDVFARVSPAEKLRIVAALRDSGEIVAVTGDGVNDAPALRRAHIGVAMGRSGTDVARETADLVLTDDNLGTIVEAIEEGRTIYANITRFVHLLFSHNLGEVLTVVAALLTATPLPLLPLQILWINLVTDVFPAFALALEPRDERDVRRPPRAAESLLSTDFLVLVAWQGLLLAAITFGAYWWAMEQYGPGAHARSVAVSALVAVQLGHLFNCRSRIDSALTGLFRNRHVWFAALTVAALQLVAATYPPLMRVLRLVNLNTADIAVMIVCLVLPIAVVDMTKWIHRRISWNESVTNASSSQPI